MADSILVTQDCDIPVVTDCTLTPKVIAIGDICGCRSCRCYPCNHAGPMCQQNSGCRSVEVSSCEDFCIVFCSGHCFDGSSAKVIISPVCGSVFEADAEVCGGVLSVRIAANSLSPGWHDALFEVKTKEGAWLTTLARFRIHDSLACPENVVVDCAGFGA